MSQRRVVVTGMGIVSPVGSTIDTAWDAICNGRSGISTVTSFDASHMKTRIAGEVIDFDASRYLSVREAKRLDNFVHYGFAAGTDALEDAGLLDENSSHDPERIGCALASGIGGLKTIEDTTEAYLKGGPRKVSPFFIPGSIINMIGGYLSLKHNLKGPNIAIVTGAASGMGRATAHLFADEGAKVAIIDINEAGLESVAGEMRAVGAEVYSVVVDLSDREAVEQAITNIAAHFGGIDILVNNAGFALPAEIDADAYANSWDTSIAVMATAQAWAIRAALPSLRNSSNPRIVNVASTEAHGATRFNSAYVVAKHASMGLTRAMAVDLGKEGITVNCICPGPIRTGITEAIPEQDKQTFVNRRTALRRYADPEEVAHATLSLVLPAASFITGATLLVDGGVTIRNA